MTEENADTDLVEETGKSFKGEATNVTDDSPFVLQQQHLRPTYSYPGSVARPDVYSRFRFITKESMNQAMAEAKQLHDEERGIRRPGAGSPTGRYLDMSKTYYEKMIKQIKLFWYEIEDYLREIETAYNEIRLHSETFDPRKRDKDEELKRQRRVNEFNARSCRTVYDLQQQTKEVFGFLDKNGNRINKPNLKKLQGIHRGVVTSLHNLLSHLPDYDLDKGLPPMYHHLAMLIRRLAQCCFELEFGQDINIVRNLEVIRQKVEDPEKMQEVHEPPLYKMVQPSKRSQACALWKPPKGAAKGPSVWQEYDAHNKGKRPPKDVPGQISDLIDLSTGQGYIAPVLLQAGIERFLRMRMPRKKGFSSKLLSALRGGPFTDDDEEAVEKKLKKLQHEFMSSIQGEVQALFQEAKKITDVHSKKPIQVGYAQVDTPTEAMDALMKHQEVYQLSQHPTTNEQYVMKQKAKMNEVMGLLSKVDSELKVRDPRKVVLMNPDILTGQGDMPDGITKGKRRRRTRSPVTISKPRSEKSHFSIGSPCSEMRMGGKSKLPTTVKSPRKSVLHKRGVSPKDGLTTGDQLSRSGSYYRGSKDGIRGPKQVSAKFVPTKTENSSTKGGDIAIRGEGGVGKGTSGPKLGRLGRSTEGTVGRSFEGTHGKGSEGITRSTEATTTGINANTGGSSHREWTDHEQWDYGPSPESGDAGRKSANGKVKGAKKSGGKMVRSKEVFVGAGTSLNNGALPESMGFSHEYDTDYGNGKSRKLNIGDRELGHGLGDYAPFGKNDDGGGGERSGLVDMALRSKKMSESIKPSGRDALVYMMQEERPPSGETSSPKVDEEQRVSSSPRTRSQKSAGNVAGENDNELQWALQGSLTLWNQKQVDEMLDKVKDMEDEQQMIRMRWQDMIQVDPTMKGLGSNYKIAYGENPEYGEAKEPDAIVLMKPSAKKDTVVVVTALPTCNEDEGAISEPATSVRSQTSQTTASKIDSHRRRAGWDLSQQCVFIHLPTEYLEAINSNALRFEKYLQKTAQSAVGSFDPCRIIEDVADEILNDMFMEVAGEIADIPETCVKDVYNAEFVQA